jgi:hypothetical protein
MQTRLIFIALFGALFAVCTLKAQDAGLNSQPSTEVFEKDSKGKQKLKKRFKTGPDYKNRRWKKEGTRVAKKLRRRTLSGPQYKNRYAKKRRKKARFV